MWAALPVPWGCGVGAWGWGLPHCPCLLCGPPDTWLGEALLETWVRALGLEAGWALPGELLTLWPPMLPSGLLPGAGLCVPGRGHPLDLVCVSNCVHFYFPSSPAPSTPHPLPLHAFVPVSPHTWHLPPGAWPNPSPHGLHLPGTAWLAAWRTAAPGSLRHAGSRGVQSLPHQLGL